MEGNKRQALYWADEAKHKTKQCKVIQLTGEQRHNKGALWQRDKGRHFKYTEEREETPGNETRPRWAESNWWNRGKQSTMHTGQGINNIKHKYIKRDHRQ